MISRPTNRVFRALLCAWAALLLQAAITAAPAVRVTLELENTVLKVGDITTAHVKAEIVPDQLSNTLQIVTWYVDLVNSAPTAIEIVPNSVIVPEADSDPSTSSRGALTAGSLRGVYDTFFNSPNAGHDGPIELFSVRVKAIAVGAANFSVVAGTGAPALAEDFIVSTINGDPVYGGLYNTATVQVTSFNNVPPTITSTGNITINEGATARANPTARDADVGQILRFSFATAAPNNATLDPITGAFAWTPTEAQSPNAFPIKIKVSDNGTPVMSATNEFIVFVNEVNSPPLLQAPAAITRAEFQAISATCTATDPDILLGRTPNTNRLTFSLVDPPAGAAINPTTGVFSWTPTEAQGPGAYTVKVVVTDDGVPPLAATNQFSVTITELNAAPTLASPGNRTIAEGATLNVAFVGSDVDLPANQLTYSVVSAPTGAVLDPGTGLVTWTPTEAQGPGVFTFSIRVSDNAPAPLFATNTMQVTVTEVNSPPALGLLPDRTVVEATPLNFTATVSDPDLPGQALAFSLDTPPAGASINPTTGAFTWTPTEAQGPGRYTIVVRVTDNGSPARTDTKSFDVSVNEQNAPPILVTPTGQGTQTIPELIAKTIQFSATDSDLPANNITFSLQNAPNGAVIDPVSGLFSWTPSEAQGPGVYAIRVVATDNHASPASTTNTINLTVSESNTAPTIRPIDDQIIDELSTLTVNVSATDSDLPAQTLTYSLVTPPAGVTINPTTGVMTWTPTEAQGPGRFNITVRAAETAAGGVFATRLFSVTVNEVNRTPVFGALNPLTVSEMAPITARFIATDPDVVTGQTPSTNRLTYTLLDAPTGMAINADTGVLTWTPTEQQGPGTYDVRASVTDNGLPPITALGVLRITVNESNRTPAISAPQPQTIAELTTLSTNFFVSDADFPTNTLSFVLISAPAGVQLNSTNGAVTWTPTEAQGPGVFAIVAAVVDNGSPSLRNTNTINVTVTEVNTPPTLAPIPDFTIVAGNPVSITASATDADLPAQTITYSLVSAPAGATINPTTGVFAWTPTSANAGQQFTITVRATESGAASLSDSKTFRITVNARPNTAPVIASPGNQSIAVGATLTVNNIALDADTNTLAYALVAGPTGVTVNPATGVLTWTPTAAQVGQSTIRVKVTDNGVPPLSSTNTFAVTVTSTTGRAATLQVVSVLTGGTTVRIEGDVNTLYSLEYSTNLVNWTPLTSVTIGAQGFSTHLDAVHGLNQREGFYRAKSGP